MAVFEAKKEEEKRADFGVFYDYNFDHATIDGAIKEAKDNSIRYGGVKWIGKRVASVESKLPEYVPYEVVAL